MPWPATVPRAVFLDVGGPVYDDRNYVVAVLRALDEMRAERGEQPVDRGTFERVYDDVRQGQRGSLRTALAESFLGSADRRHELHERTRAYWTHPPGTLYPDVLPLLRTLHGRVTVGIVANQERTVVDSLERDGVAPYVSVWGVSAVVGLEKPSRAFFEWAMAEAGATAEECVHIGNRLDTDVRPARALGLSTVWVLRGEAPPEPTPEQLGEPDLAVRDLTGLGARLLAPEAGR
jgi:FMN phosphatase YigB (HAD superfamily)